MEIHQEIRFIIVMSFIFLIGTSLGLLIEEPRVVFEELDETISPKVTISISDGEISRSATKLAAVDSEGNGVLTDMYVRAVRGDGRVLVDVDNLLFWIDTQQSIQKAKEVAEDFIGTEVEEIDLTYSIDINKTNLVGGPSAGAAFAVATVSTLQNKTLKEDTIITGTIEEGGTIGKVGGILAKGIAVKESGYKKFLVPEGEKIIVENRREKECESIGSFETCRIDYGPIEIDVQKELGIEVIEVKNLEEALEHMVQI